MDVVVSFARAWAYVSRMCETAREIWRDCEETFSFMLRLRQRCTGEPRSNYIHNCFNRLERIGEEIRSGPGGEGIRARLRVLLSVNEQD
jgi:hypothetical protein